MDELFEEKMKIVLNLIRTNNSSTEALQITQAIDNLARARNNWNGVELEKTTGTKPTRKQGAGS